MVQKKRPELPIFQERAWAIRNYKSGTSANLDQDEHGAITNKNEVLKNSLETENCVLTDKNT